MHMWIVEMWVDVYTTREAQWEPTTGAATTRADARLAIQEWRQNNPHDRFRLRLYMRRTTA